MLGLETLTGRVLHGIFENLHHLSIIKSAITAPLQTAERPSFRVVWNLAFERVQSRNQLLRRELLQGLLNVLEDFSLQKVVEPFLITLRNSRVESVEQVEFRRDLITHATRRTVGIEVLVDSNSRIQSPGGGGVVAVGQAPEIVV